MEGKEIIKALRVCAAAGSCADCPCCQTGERCARKDTEAANLIEKQAMEIQELRNSLAVLGQANAALRDKVPEWISVEEQLPDTNKSASGYEQVTVIATDGKRVRPMIYERACVRGKTKYRWKWIWDKIYDGNPITYWTSLPELPEEKET